MANRSIGIRKSKGSKTTRKKQLAPADSRVEILLKMAVIESKVAGRSGGIRGLSVKVGVWSMAFSERCREQIAKAIPSGDSRKSRNWARWSVRTKTPAHRMSSVAKADQHRAAPVRFRKKRHNVKWDIVLLRQGMANPHKDTSRINIPDGALVQGSTNGQVLKTSKR
ncbi:hypothetical protein B0H13DRAFT_1893662 [Mycena leptocephala]|nr:hypothetical protein B0H13DRAFT_1893662 [Mycena leptocephala]